MTTIIGYRRVSTDKQGRSGLGLDAQDRNLATYREITGGRMLKTYTEVESGKRSDNRPELQKALAHAKRSGAVLAVGVLDRLSRNSYFINKLLETRVPFVDCQSPHDSPFVTRIKAAMAQEELEKISQRTRDALAEYKAHGGKLGAARPECRNLTQAARERGARRAAEVRSAKADEAYLDLLPQMQEWRKSGLSLIAIAERLNDEGHTTRRGKPWNHVQVARVLARA